MTNLSHAELVEAFEFAGYRPQGYSGRNMYGRECLGIFCNDSMANVVLKVVSNLLLAEIYMPGHIAKVCEALRNPREDAMGKGRIIYWPSIPWMGD